MTDTQRRCLGGYLQAAWMLPLAVVGLPVALAVYIGLLDLVVRAISTLWEWLGHLVFWVR